MISSRVMLQFIAAFPSARLEKNGKAKAIQEVLQRKRVVSRLAYAEEKLNLAPLKQVYM